MTYYHPAPKSIYTHHLAQGFLSMRTLVDREDRWRRYQYHGHDLAAPARTMVFDTPEGAAEWWAGAYGTEIVLLQIDGDVTLEENSPPVPEGMFFLTGEIPPEQVSLYEAPSPAP
jgi:hypothetical protein